MRSQFFVLDLFAFPKSFFLCFIFSRKRFSQNPRSSRSVFQGISGGLWNKSFIAIFSSQSYIICCPFSRLCFTERRLLGYGFKDLVPLHKLSVKVDNDQPRSQSSLSCFKKERFSLGARERTLETRLDNDRQTDDLTSGKRDVVTHGSPLAVEGCAESSLNFFYLALWPYQ